MALKASTATTVAMATIRENSQAAGLLLTNTHTVLHIDLRLDRKQMVPLSLATYTDPSQFGQRSILSHFVSGASSFALNLD